MNSTMLIFKTEILVYQPKANLDKKISSGKGAHLLDPEIDLLAILQNSLDRALFLYIFIQDVRSSGVRASTTIVHVRKFFKVHQYIVRFRIFARIAKRSERSIRIYVRLLVHDLLVNEIQILFLKN